MIPLTIPTLICYAVIVTIWAVIATWDAWRSRRKRRPDSAAVDRIMDDMIYLDGQTKRNAFNINRILEKI